MSSLEQGLGKEVKELMANPSPEKRQEITDKISNYFSNDIFNDKERRIAIDVIRLLTKDSETRVRKTLANNLKFTTDIPTDIILTLANDEQDEVATPVLECSSVLSQENLISIVSGCNHLAKLIAISRRTDVGVNLSDALVNTYKEEVIESLVKNKDAEISEDTFLKTLDKFAKSGVIMDAIVDRGGLSYDIIERIMSVVSDDLKKKLVNDYQIKSDVANDAVNANHEDTVLDFLSEHNDEAKKHDLVEHLFASGKLTHSLILRSLCKGDLKFFEYSLSKLSDMSPLEVNQILYHEGVSSFSSLYKKADMPKGTFDAVNIILRFALQELQKGNVSPNTQNFTNKILEKIIEGGYDSKVNMMKYFLVLMKSKVSFPEADDKAANS